MIFVKPRLWNNTKNLSKIDENASQKTVRKKNMIFRRFSSILATKIDSKIDKIAFKT